MGLALSCALAHPASAKKVSIEWKPLKGAASYEIEIQRDGKSVARKKVQDPEWSGELPFGIFAYQIRGVDRIKRPGQWTQAMPLVVMPAPPELKSMDHGRKITQYSAKAGNVFSWKPVEGASQYRVEILRKGSPPQSHIVSGSSLTLKGLAAGDYRWKVTALVKPKGRVPASMTSRQWESKPSELGEFSLERALLERPSPKAPLGTMPPPGDRKVLFKWSEVAGADAYELELLPKAASPDRAPAAGKAPAQIQAPIQAMTQPLTRLVVKDTSATVSVPRDGAYTWRVRALANIDETKTPGAAGPQSTADFNLDKNASFYEGSGYVALSTMFAPYTYQVESPATGRPGSASSSALTGRLSGEYWFRAQWGAAAAFELTQFQIAGQSFSRKGAEAVLKYRLNFGEGKYNWGLSPKLGLEGRDYFQLFAPGSAFSTFFSQVYGIQAGLDLRKAINDRFSVGIKLAYFKPLLLSSSGADSLTSDASNRNVSLGAQVLYWVSRRVGLGAGAYVERRSISYTLTNAPASVTEAEKVFTDGTYFFGSVIYSFGR
jgi:hypothetical protein